MIDKLIDSTYTQVNNLLTISDIVLCSVGQLHIVEWYTVLSEYIAIVPEDRRGKLYPIQRKLVAENPFFV